MQNVLLQEIAKMKSPLISQQQSKIDAELALLNEKRELLKELHDMKVSVLRCLKLRPCCQMLTDVALMVDRVVLKMRTQQ